MLDFMADLRITSKYDKPIQISEFGAGAKYGRRSKDADMWSEDYQFAVYRAQLICCRKARKCKASARGF